MGYALSILEDIQLAHGYVSAFLKGISLMLGGEMNVMLGSVSAFGISILSEVDLHQERNRYYRIY
jgi:xanthine/uracil permease